VTQTSWEKVIVPLVHFSVLCYLPVKNVWQSTSQAFVFANGQFMLFSREVYDKIGGHESVKNALVEDVWLCKAVKKVNGKPMVFRGVEEVSCRMYRNFKDAYEGFSKNLFPGLGYNLLAITMISLLSALFYIVPFGFLAYGFISGQFTLTLFILPLIQILLGLLLRVVIAIWFKLSLPESLLHFLSISVFILIAINSVRWIKFGRGALWKGRRYKFS
jgi:chlorobactene glucosyltransferase